MKAAKARELTEEELVKKERDIREELFRFRFQHATGQLENPIRLRLLRRDMARIITIRKEKLPPPARKRRRQRRRQVEMTDTDRGRSKIRVGMVVGTGMDKTAVVKVERPKRHPRFHKYLMRSTKYLVHDERNQLKVGDKVRIVETRPMSRRKNWRLLSVVEQSR